MLFRLIVILRWARLTTRRYGFRALFTSYRPKRAAIGHGIRRNVFGRCHGWGTPAMYLVRQIQLERSLMMGEGPTVSLA
jgi:hypothetical protein